MTANRARPGAYGEKLAREYLEARGYSTVATNFRCPAGEMDIIVQDESYLVFVEVRSRSSDSHGTPQESITRRKQERLVAVAETFLQENVSNYEEWRIDVVAVRIGPTGAAKVIDHVKHAVEQS